MIRKNLPPDEEEGVRLLAPDEEPSDPYYGSPVERVSAREAGWRMDSDYWWTRPERPGDEIGVKSLGDTQAFTMAGITTCRTANQALQIDHEGK